MATGDMGIRRRESDKEVNARINCSQWISFPIAVYSGTSDTSMAMAFQTTVASLTKEVNPRFAKRPLIFNGRLNNRGLTYLIKEATEVQ